MASPFCVFYGIHYQWIYAIFIKPCKAIIPSLIDHALLNIESRNKMPDIEINLQSSTHTCHQHARGHVTRHHAVNIFNLNDEREKPHCRFHHFYLGTVVVYTIHCTALHMYCVPLRGLWSVMMVAIVMWTALTRSPVQCSSHYQHSALHSAYTRLGPHTVDILPKSSSHISTAVKISSWGL